MAHGHGDDAELRTSLEGCSAREWTIMPLVSLSIAGMGVCYSLLPDDMTKRVIPAECLKFAVANMEI